MKAEDLVKLKITMVENGYAKTTAMRAADILSKLPQFRTLDPDKVTKTIVDYTQSMEVCIQRDPRYHKFLEDCGAMIKMSDTQARDIASSKESLEKALGGLIWHLHRTEGIGGSDVGVIANGSDGFSSINDILRTKRVEGGIGDASEHTLRGTLLEPIANAVYERKMAKEHGDNFVRLSDSVDSTGIHAWAIGNTDFRGLVLNDNNTVDYIIDDYKCPKSEKAAKYKISEAELPKGYIGQLHHYGMGTILGESDSILNEIQEHFPDIVDIGQVNIKIGLLTINLGAFEPVITSLLERDISTGMISEETYDTMSFVRAVLSKHSQEASITRTPVMVNVEALKERNQKLDDFWQNVVAGEVEIEVESKGKEVLDAEELGIPEEDIKKLVVLNAINKVSKKEEDKLSKSIKGILEDNGYLGEVSLGSGVLKFNINKKRVTTSIAHEDELIKALEKKDGFEIGDCKVLDKKSLLAAAASFGITDGIATKESTGNSGFPTAKSEAGIALKDFGEEMMATIDSKIAGIAKSEDVINEANGILDMDGIS